MERPKLNLFQKLKSIVAMILGSKPVLEQRLRAAGRHHCGRVGKGKARNPNPRKRELANRRHAKHAAKARR